MHDFFTALSAIWSNPMARAAAVGVAEKKRFNDRAMSDRVLQSRIQMLLPDGYKAAIMNHFDPSRQAAGDRILIVSSSGYPQSAVDATFITEDRWASDPYLKERIVDPMVRQLMEKHRRPA